MPIENDGIMIILSSPSGAGKTTLVSLLSGIENFEISISHTTRKPRAKEVQNKDYHFVEEAEFERLIKNQEFLEYAKVFKNYYGSLKENVIKKLAKGQNVIFDIDVEGGLNLKKQFGERALSVFIKAPSLDVLKERLMARNTEDQENLNMRLDKAQSEMAYAKYFDLVIVNDDLEMAQEQAYQRVMDFING